MKTLSNLGIALGIAIISLMWYCIGHAKGMMDAWSLWCKRRSRSDVNEGGGKA